MVLINQKKLIQVNAKTLQLHLKVRDQCSFTIHDEQGQEILDYDDYVPGFFPGDHYGDYIIFDIDLESGQITNWEKPEPKDIEELLKKDEEE